MLKFFDRLIDLSLINSFPVILSVFSHFCKINNIGGILTLSNQNWPTSPIAIQYEIILFAHTFSYIINLGLVVKLEE